MSLNVKLLSDFAIIPTRSSPLAAGYDLYSAYDTVIPARGRSVVKTDISISIPLNTYARIAPRSGLASKHFIGVGAGVVDGDYRGPVGVVLFNHSEEDFVIKSGHRIAQLILENITMVDIDVVHEHDITSRGSGGFGSTGV
jgi:dUTP pyrophosphatase